MIALPTTVPIAVSAGLLALLLTACSAGAERAGDTAGAPVAEEVHVHGYDVTQAVRAGSTVDIALTASIPGGFEVELHDAGKVLCQLRVA